MRQSVDKALKELRIISYGVALPALDALSAEALMGYVLKGVSADDLRHGRGPWWRRKVIGAATGNWRRVAALLDQRDPVVAKATGPIRFHSSIMIRGVWVCVSSPCPAPFPSNTAQGPANLRPWSEGYSALCRNDLSGGLDHCLARRLSA